MNPSVVTFHYTLRDTNAKLLDTSEGGEPITYLEGAGHIIEGLEEQLRGASAGLKQRISVPAAKAYGLRDEAQVQCIPRSALPIDGDLQPGDRFQAGDDRFAPIVMVTKIEGDNVWLDANHPLAGVDLTFDVEIVEVRPATPDEVARGQPKCADGQCGCGH